MQRQPIKLNPNDKLAQRLDEVAGQPVVIANKGIRYRIEPEDPFAFSDPEKAKAAIRAGAGAFKGSDVEQFLADIREARGHGPETDEEHRALFRRIVRDVKPEKQPIEYGAETRYGRDSHSNGRYNDALDEFEAALLSRLAEKR